jgi:hypothetical protein
MSCRLPAGDHGRTATDLALQVALLVPILAALLGLFSATRMMRLPDVEPTAGAEAAALA